MIQYFVWIVIGIAGFIPTVKLLNYYRLTKIIDYLLMACAFAIALFQIIIVILLEKYQKTLILYQLNDFLYPSFILMFLIHGFRMKWEKTPRPLVLISLIWYLGLVLSVFFYKLITLPDEGQVLFFHLENSSSRETGQMFEIDNVYIIGRGFEFYAHAFRIYSIIIILTAYLDTENLARLIKVREARRIFILSIISSGVYPIVLMGEMLQIWNILLLLEWHIFDLFTFLGIAYISITHPQTLLISKTQILRTLELMENLQPPESKLKFEESDFEEYIKMINQTISQLVKQKSSE